MERDGRGGKGGKINQGETDAEVMSRRTCANRSGSLARRFAESNRIFCHTTWNRRLRTVPYLNPVTYSTPSLYFFYIVLFITPLHYVSYLPSPFSCSHLKLPLDILFLSISLSLLPLLISPPSPPNHVYKRSFNTKGCVLRDPHREGCWQGSRHYQSKTSKLLGLAERRLGVHRRCTRGCCLERGLGRSRRAWHDYALRNHHSKCRVHVPFL